MVETIMALDFGTKRVGVAVADSDIKISRPIEALTNDKDLFVNLNKLVEANKVSEIVVGLPRNLNGNETMQTKLARKFATELKNKLELPVHMIDEAVTSIEAEELLKHSKLPYTKGDIDSMSATLILDNYLGVDGGTQI